MPKQRQKKLQKVADLPVVMVLWEDASIQLDHEAILDGELPVEKLAFGGLYEREDVGFLVHRDSKRLILAVSRCQQDQSISHSITIPAKWIKTVTVLSPAEPV